MTPTGSRLRPYAPLFAALLLTSALGACNSKGGPDAAPSDSGSADADAAPVTLPLATTGPVTQTTAPPVTALPAGPAVGLRRLADRQQGYGWLDRANYQEEAVEDAPPDYSFDEDGVRPWTWSSGDGSRVICEPVAGGYRQYFYAAGSDRPYLVRDPQYSYAYDNGALVAVFTLAGVMSDPVEGSPQASYAARYYDRGGALRRYADTGPHLPVNAYAWSDRRADLSAQRMAWQSKIAENPDWSAWNSAHANAERAQWSDVREQHQAAAQQFGAWQQQKFQGPPPQLYARPAGPEAAPAHNDHAAAVVGGMVAAGAAATAAHAVMAHQAPPAQHQTGAPPVRAAEARAPMEATNPHHPAVEPARSPAVAARPAPMHAREPAPAARTLPHAETRPVAPHPAAARPVEPRPEAPHAVAPRPAVPHPVEPHAAAPRPEAPHPAAPQPHAEPHPEPRAHEHQ